MFKRSLTVAVAVAAMMVAANLSTSAQQPGEQGTTALTSQDETTIARRLLMNAIGTSNDALHEMLDGNVAWDDFEFRDRLLAMYAMMKAFPSLFRAGSNPWSEEAEAADPARVSLSLSSVWADWESFVRLSDEAADTMSEASMTRREQMLEVVERLEVQCESCHEQFRKTFDYLDYDAVLGPALAAE